MDRNLIQYKKEALQPHRTSFGGSHPTKGWAGPYIGVGCSGTNHRNVSILFWLLTKAVGGGSKGKKNVPTICNLGKNHVVNFRLEVRNKGGHSSIPVAAHATIAWRRALRRFPIFGFPLKTQVTASYFQAMSKIETVLEKKPRSRTASKEFFMSNSSAVTRLRRVERHSRAPPAWQHFGGRARRAPIAQARRRHRKLPRPPRGFRRVRATTLP